MNTPQLNLDYVKNSYGENYANLRKKEYNLKKDYTVRELADILNITPSTISLIEKENRTPTLEQLKAYKSFFGVSYDFLTGESKAANIDNYEICRKTGLSEKSIQLLSIIGGSPEIMSVINLLFEEYTVGNEMVNGSVLSNLIKYFRTDAINANIDNGYLDYNGKLIIPKSDSAASDFAPLVSLKNVDIGALIETFLLDEIQKSLISTKEKYIK